MLIECLRCGESFDADYVVQCNDISWHHPVYFCRDCFESRKKVVKLIE
jgi:hypothetical protein